MSIQSGILRCAIVLALAVPATSEVCSIKRLAKSVQKQMQAMQSPLQQICTERLHRAKLMGLKKFCKQETFPNGLLPHT